MALFVSACFFNGCGSTQNEDSLPEINETEDLTDSRYVNLYGRNYYSDNFDGMTFINSASGFEFNFCGTAAYADICVIGSLNSMWSVFVDEETDSNARVLSFEETHGVFEKQALVEGLTDGEHSIKVLKRTSSNYDRVIVNRLSCDGKFMAAPEKPSLHIAFFGDSITCGSGVLREYKPSDSKIYTPETQNALQSYAGYCANECGASFEVFGRGGITLKYLNPATEEFSILNNYKSMAVDLSPEKGECPEYDFADVPSAVVVYLGTNDYFRSKKCDTGYSLAGMQAAFVELVDKLGSYYGTDIPIVLCSGMMCHDSGLAGAAKGAAQILKAKYPLIEAIDFDAGVTEVTGGHPVVEDSVKAGKMLADCLKGLFEQATY